MIVALAEVDGVPVAALTDAVGKRLGRALKEIKATSPEVTRGEIAGRACNYRTHFPNGALTASALAKWWGRCSQPKVDPNYEPVRIQYADDVPPHVAPRRPPMTPEEQEEMHRLDTTF